MTTQKVTGNWDASRVLRALGRIGYHPVAAILDIVDNSVSAESSKVWIAIGIGKEARSGPGRRRATITEIVIVDNGKGMDSAGLENALTLGASSKNYSESTLSKFGLGLKSAAFSLGQRLEITSRFNQGTQFRRATVDLMAIDAAGGKYEYTLEVVGEKQVNEDPHLQLIAGETGTVVRISSIYLESMPSVADVLDGLRSKTGVVYYYYIRGVVPNRPPLSIYVNEEGIAAVDPLFVTEELPDLDDRNWDGIATSWITRPKEFQIDAENKRKALVEMVQLPHPPRAARKLGLNQAEIRKKYLIDAQNYGFFIYRNYRLISWSDSLDGMVPRDQDLYSFRGRLLISSDADDLLNIDVTKSRIQLSEVARIQLTPIANEALKASRKAWNRAKGMNSDEDSITPHAEINQHLDKVNQNLERDDQFDESVASEADRKKLEARRVKAVQAKPAQPEEQRRLAEEGQRVQYVDFLPNNQLWERAHDPKLGLIVRVNKSHRFCREVMESLTRNVALLKTVDLLFFSLARAEYLLAYRSEFKEGQVEGIMGQFREEVGSQLSEFLRRIDPSVIIDETDSR